MTPDTHDTDDAASDFDLNELAGRIGNLYVRQGLCPPSQLHAAAKHWLGISHDEIVEVVRKHFAEHRRSYLCGSGDGLFHLVEAAVRQAWRDKHPPRERTDDDAERPRRRRAGGVRTIYTAGGIPDAIVEGRATRLLGDPESNVERPSGLPGVPIEDDEADA